MLARELTGKPCYYRMTTSSLILLGRNSLLPIENEEVLELGKELQVVVQATSDSDTKTKGVLTINLHSRGRGKHESKRNLDWNGVGWSGMARGMYGLRTKIRKENTGRLRPERLPKGIILALEECRATTVKRETI